LVRILSPVSFLCDRIFAIQSTIFFIIQALVDTITDFQIFTRVIAYSSRLGGVVVSVLATGPKGRRFETGQGEVLLRAMSSAKAMDF
jgi:hypothetical protein